MNDAHKPDPHLPNEQLQALDAICNRFEDAWRDGPPPRLEDYLAQMPAEHQRALFIELLELELVWAQQRGEPVRLEALRFLVRWASAGVNVPGGVRPSA